MLALVLSLTGCGPVDGDTSRDSTLGYADAACPAEISAVIVADLSCGRLIVPERRGQTESRRTIELLVARVTPPTPSDKEPMFVAGTELGSNVDYGGIAPLAQRVDRDVIFLAARGTGYAKPSLQCPEVDALGDADLANPINDPTTRQAYLREVGACHQRLTSEGIDVSAYNLAEMAADAEDLRRALGIRTWNVITYGTASRIALEMLRADPSRIRTVTLDSPELPGTDPRLLAVDATRDAIAAVLTACAEDADCVKDYPDVRQSFTKALLSVQAEPLDLALANQPPDGRSVIVHVDPGMLVRLLRQMLSEGAGLRHPRAVPRVLDAVSDRRTAELTEIATAFVGDSAYCNGYQTRCVPSLRRAPGVLFTTLCHDIAPFSDPTQPSQHARNQLGFDLAYGQSPYLEVCRHWPVERR